ncbi:BAR_ACAPs and ArfGap_ACAP domain-containing protein isoform X2 [Danio rerio]|uniref:Arf-GAP with coiled-coil, ANK repeat and PH domain-containing protein n=1 Tax=Danio rerio TaxID=7955 RepID=A0A8M9QBT1_DANRE
MDTFLDFEDCIRDSPAFRQSLDKCESDMSELESRVEKVMKLCGQMVDAGQNYTSCNQLFLCALSEFTAYHKSDGVILNCLRQFNQGLQEMIQFQTMLFDQTQRAISQQLTNLLSQFVPQIRETRREFVRIGDDLDSAVVKNAQVSRHKPVDAERATHLLLATRKCYQHFALDYCLQDASGEAVIVCNPSDGGTIQGYLFKRSRKKNKTWKRCWFSTENNQLIYLKSHKEQPVVLFDDLRLCAVKSLDVIDRRFCFELLSVQKCCVLQADSEELKSAWMNAVQGCIDMAYRDQVTDQNTQVKVSSAPVSIPDPPSHPPALGVALSGRGNQHCCDCGEAEPRWASVNLGITMCIECSGIHRSLGVHLSKVRSLTLDSWEPEQLKLLCVLGNEVINGIYEREAADVLQKPSAGSPRQDKEQWIRSKYVEKRFVARHPDGPDADALKLRARQRLYSASVSGDLVAMAEALAEGAEINWNNNEQEGRTALIGSAIGGSLLACEFLLQNGANVNHRDQRGQGALHAAATYGHTGQVCLLLKRGANQYAADEKGNDPLSIAIETAHADIVTLLRMARMNEEMRDSEGFFGSVGDDETFQDIFRDFSNMASHDPEKLTRRPFIRSSEEEQQDEEEKN